MLQIDEFVWNPTSEIQGIQIIQFAQFTTISWQTLPFSWQKNANISKALSLVVCPILEASLTLICNLRWHWLEFMVYKSGICLKFFLHWAHQIDYVVVKHKQNIFLGPCKFKFTIYSWVSLITIILQHFWNVNLLKIKWLTEVQCLLKWHSPGVSFICHPGLTFVFCM